MDGPRADSQESNIRELAGIDLTESECELFRQMQLSDVGRLTETDISTTLSGSPNSLTPSMRLGQCDPMTKYLNVEFKAFLEKRGTYQELHNVVAKVLLKLLDAKKPDGTQLLIVNKENGNSRQNISECDQATSALLSKQNAKPKVESSVTPDDTCSLIDILDQETPDNTDQDQSPCLSTDIPSECLDSGQSVGSPVTTEELKKTVCSPVLTDGASSINDRLNKMAFGVLPGLNLPREHGNRQKLARYTGHLPPFSGSSLGSSHHTVRPVTGDNDPAMTLRDILQEALHSVLRHAKREIALGQKLGFIIEPRPQTKMKLYQP